jgi:ABC-type amino acid transport substrate-binding protein
MKSSRRYSTKSQNNKNISIPYIISHRDINTIKPNTLTVAAYPHFYPICYYNSAGNLAGLDVDIMKKFAKEAKLNIVFKEFNSFKGIWNKPAIDKADISIGGIANSKGRTRVATEWSIPYFYVKRSILFKKSNPIRSFPDDVNETVVGTEGSTGWNDAKILLKSVNKQRFLRKGKSEKEDLSDLLSGKISGLIRGDFISRAIIRKNPKLGMIEWEADQSILSSDGEVFAFPTKKGSGIAILLSAFLTDNIHNGYMIKLMKKYYLTNK